MKKLINLLKWFIPVFLLLLSIVIYFLAYRYVSFADWFRDTVFPVTSTYMGRLSSMATISVGELFILIGILMIGLLLLSGIFFLCSALKILSKRIKKSNNGAIQTPVNNGRIRLVKKIFKFYYVVFFIFSVFSLIMVTNCFILYRTSTIFQENGWDNDYEEQDLEILRNNIVEKVNALSELVERDEDGLPYTEIDIAAEMIQNLQELGETYPRLSGYYVSPKFFYFSGFISQQMIMGYYFPFTMEANINGLMAQINYPSVIAHELAHTKGYILEDEANFWGYLACINSDNAFVQYSGYLGILGYLDRDYYNSIGRDEELYMDQPIISDQVKADRVFLTEEEWNKVEEKALFSTDTVEKAADWFLNTNLNVNGVSDGTVSYSRVIKLLLEYYDGILY